MLKAPELPARDPEGCPHSQQAPQTDAQADIIPLRDGASMSGQPCQEPIESPEREQRQGKSQPEPLIPLRVSDRAPWTSRAGRYADEQEKQPAEEKPPMQFVIVRE